MMKDSAKHNNRKSTAARILYLLVLSILLFTGIVGGRLIGWYQDTFNVTYQEVMFTIKAPLAGADTHFLRDAVRYCMPAFIVFALVMALIILLMVMARSGRDNKRSASGFGHAMIIGILCLVTFWSCAGAVTALHRADDVLQYTAYLRSQADKSTIYEDYYVKPDADSIASDNSRNLLYIVMESMETTYASQAAGGAQEYFNYIPHLTELAGENVSFSNTDRLGGFRSLNGTNWTMGSIFSTESGIPFAFPIEVNSMNTREKFASGTVTLGDILHEKGYYQEFLCGSDGDFAGRKMFFLQHGYDNVYDLYSAIDDGYIEQENDWWGFEDTKLYEIAKDELTRMYDSEGHFNMTMLTVDTHHVNGWVCSRCGSDHPEQLANVVECADNQIYEFIEWCRTQPWFEDTTIIIQGDHPRMDNYLVDGVEYLDRTIYNCFINPADTGESFNTTGREFASFDMFPTILASIGFSIPGDRLGLGTNMFSQEPTLCEKLGYNELNEELKKGSNYYMKFY